MTLDEVIKRFIHNAEYERTHGSLQGCLEFRQLAEWLTELKKLKEQTETCEDAISRSHFDERVRLAGGMADEELTQDFKDGVLTVLEMLKTEPSVQPQKVGRWIEKDGYDCDVYYDCSACGNSWTTIDGTPWDNGMNYCPCCGAKMVEPQENEDK